MRGILQAILCNSSGCTGDKILAKKKAPVDSLASCRASERDLTSLITAASSRSTVAKTKQNKESDLKSCCAADAADDRDGVESVEATVAV